MRIFYVLYPAEPALQSGLDAIRFLANPREKERAHLTVRGPCARHYQARTLARLNDKIAGAVVQVSEPRTFWHGAQNTVYLSCSADALRAVWHKPDYDYHPHITVYDGDSRELSAALLALLSRRPLLFSFRAARLLPLLSVKGQTSLTLQTSVALDELSRLVGRPLSLAAAQTLDLETRLRLIERVWNDLGERCGTPAPQPPDSAYCG